MLTNWFLQLAFLAAAGAPKLVAAGAGLFSLFKSRHLYLHTRIDTDNTYLLVDPSAIYDNAVQQPLNPPGAVANSSSPTIEGELLLDECDTSITACATTADIKVIRTHKSTLYVTNLHVIESITVLSLLNLYDLIFYSDTSSDARPIHPDCNPGHSLNDDDKHRRYITLNESSVSAVLTNHQGQCRETRVYEETTPLIVTVDVNTTTVREFVPIIPTTVLTTSWVKHKQTSQCIIRKTSTGLASGFGSSSAAPVPSASSSQHPAPPAGSSGPKYNSGQPAPSAPPAHPSSSHGSGRPSSAPPSSSQQAPVGSGSASGASSSTSSSTSKRTP
ncbi:hypothetical protein BGZ63DRAFT_426520 [Mariannaea sp. PMI_226]|nr:hypothetical protein BGZ63DRAFT_426520 [Mariannaea sp. PMI_226]